MERMICDACGIALEPNAFYVVRIDVFADPSVPAVTTEELAEMDPGKTLEALIEQMKGMSAEELQDQVHRRFEYRVCGGCQREFLRNPLGLPRVRREGRN